MRRLFVLLLLGAAVLAQDLDRRLARAVVRVDVDDRGRLEAERLIARNASEAQLEGVRILQPYRLVLTGLVVSAKGEILTPALHPRADLQVVVTTFDGSKHLATVRGTDPISNLALVRIATKTPDHFTLRDRPPVKMEAVRLLGPSTDPRLRRDPAQGIGVAGNVGRKDMCMAFHDLYSGTTHHTAVLAVITAPWTPRAGSACIDSRGRLVGMVVGGMPPRAVRTGRGDARILQGHFVIPAARIARVLAQLRAHGKVYRSYYGMRLAPVPAVLRAHFELPSSAASVARIQPGGPAARAGVKLHDVLLTVDGACCGQCTELGELLTERVPNKPVRLELLRGGEKISLEIEPVALK